MLAGTVVHGDGRGRGLGFATANVAVDDERSAGLEEGVYAALVDLAADGEVRHPAVVNIGRRPTFGCADGLTVEVHILDFEGDLYGRHLRVTLVRRLRGERRFASAEALTTQIARDIETARDACRALGRHPGDPGTAAGSADRA